MHTEQMGNDINPTMTIDETLDELDVGVCQYIVSGNPDVYQESWEIENDSISIEQSDFN